MNSAKYKLDDARNSLSRKVRKSRDEEIDAFLTRKRDQDHWIEMEGSERGGPMADRDNSL